MRCYLMMPKRHVRTAGIRSAGPRALVLTLPVLVSAACGGAVPNPSVYQSCVERGEKEDPQTLILDDIRTQETWTPAWDCEPFLAAGQPCGTEQREHVAWFISAELDELDEPHLSDSDEQSVYRLVAYDGHNRFMVRAVERGGKRWVVVKGTRETGFRERVPTQRITRRIRPLSVAGWESLVRAIEASNLESLPAFVPQTGEIAFDGGMSASVEVATPSNHYRVHRVEDLGQVVDAFLQVGGCDVAFVTE